MSHLSMWILVATLGQAPADASLLSSVPAEADVVISVRGMEAVRNDLVAMVKAMSPALGMQVEPALEQQVAQFKTMHGEEAATRPFLALIRAVMPENPGEPPFAVVVKSSSYEGVLKGAAGGKAPTLKHDDGGFDSFDGPNGQTWYAAKGTGAVAFGPDKVLIAAFAKPGEKALGKTLSAAHQKRLLGGDLGLYVNLNTLSARYAEQIAQAKQGLLGALDAAGQQMGQAGMMDAAKAIYGGMFDSLKVADVLTLNLDFAAEGLNLSGDLTVKADSDAAKQVVASQAGDAAGIAKLPADFAYFVYMDLDARTFDQLQMMGLRMMAPGGKPTPEMEAALKKQAHQGRVETLGATSIDKGINTLNITNTPDAKALLAASEAMFKAMKGGDSPLNFYKDVTITPKAETYAGFTFSRVEMTLDLDKLAKMQPGNPGAGAGLAAMFGGDRMTSWYGINDTQMIQVAAPSWEKAKAQIDSYLKGTSGLGVTAGFQAVRAKLPKQVGFLGLFSAQGLTRQFASQFSAMFNNPNLKVPEGLPKDPALIGVSLSPTPPNGYEFHLFVPSAVGTVVEKGMVPLFQGLQGGPKP